MNRGMFGFTSSYEDEGKVVFESGDVIDGVVQNRTTGSSWSYQIVAILPLVPIKVYTLFWHTRASAKCNFREYASGATADILEDLYSFTSGVGYNTLSLPRPRVLIPPATYYFGINMAATTFQDNGALWSNDDFKITATFYDGSSYSYSAPVKFQYQRGKWR